jgi:hypothetical protein
MTLLLDRVTGRCDIEVIKPGVERDKAFARLPAIDRHKAFSGDDYRTARSQPMEAVGVRITFNDNVCISDALVHEYTDGCWNPSFCRLKPARGDPVGQVGESGDPAIGLGCRPTLIAMDPNAL